VLDGISYFAPQQAMAAFGFGDRRAAGCFQHGEAQAVLNGVGMPFYGVKVLNCFSNIAMVSRFSEAAQHHFCENVDDGNTSHKLIGPLELKFLPLAFFGLLFG